MESLLRSEHTPKDQQKKIPMQDNCRGLWGDAGNNSKSQAKMSTTSVLGPH